MMANEQFAGIRDAIEDTPGGAAGHFGVKKARISDLCRGKLNQFGLDILVNMVEAARRHIEGRVVEAEQA